ncbi:hypothetical protein V4F39_16400 [Aquincola sp. MAHUQ-54]|uniref:Lipoprotein n=1 Tax=Aquincola agrisoli TaxID=3119538 RepID=A0AAW9QGK0_9BURK
MLFPGRRWLAALAAGGAMLAACSPTLNWREVRPEGAEVQALFPCKPSGPTRRVPLGAASVDMTVLACDASDMTFALTIADVHDPAQVGVALDALVAAAAANLRASTAPQAQPLQVPGATPHAGARRLRIEGRRPDGGRIEAHVALFTRGTRVYQATVLGPWPVQEAVDTFQGGLRAGG